MRAYRNSTMASVEQIRSLLREAKTRVRILGVVALDADWEELADSWGRKLNEDENFSVEVLCESDNMLFSKAFTTDTDRAENRQSFRQLKFIRDLALDLPKLALAAGAPARNEGRSNGPAVKGLSLRVIHLNIPIAVVEVDGRIFANLWLQVLHPTYEEISQSHPWHGRIVEYLETYLDDQHGGKYSASPGAEILELFDHDRIPRGIYPRSSFYDTDYNQLVVWALVFDRRGKLLIHRRADNAKDNKGMWDKSVGGHVDFSLDVDTSRAILREVIEELLSDEVKEKTRLFSAWAPTDQEIVYLGEWRPEQRRRYPFQEIATYQTEWAYFRLRDSQHLSSPRLFGDRTRGLRVIADVYLFVAGPGLTDDSLGELKNSTFKLIPLSELKTAMEKSRRLEPVPDFDPDPKKPIPQFTPDLENIMTGKLREVLEEFSQFIRRYLARD